VIIVTGFDGHLCAMSNFPSVMTISGAMFELGRAGTEKLIGITENDKNSSMHIVFGASCACVECMTD
jgi:hypothetical protein